MQTLSTSSKSKPTFKVCPEKNHFLVCVMWCIQSVFCLPVCLSIQWETVHWRQSCLTTLQLHTSSFLLHNIFSFCLNLSLPHGLTLSGSLFCRVYHIDDSPSGTTDGMLNFAKAFTVSELITHTHLWLSQPTVSGLLGNPVKHLWSDS